MLKSRTLSLVSGLQRSRVTIRRLVSLRLPHSSFLGVASNCVPARPSNTSLRTANPQFQMIESAPLHCGKDGTATIERNTQLCCEKRFSHSSCRPLNPHLILLLLSLRPAKIGPALLFSPL